MNNKKHIVLYLASLPYGGTERVAINLATYFWKKGHRVTIVTTYKLDNEMPYPSEIERVITEPDDSVFDRGRIGNFIKRCSNLRKIWKSLAPDVVLSFIGKNNMMALLTTACMNIPVYVAVRGDPEAEYYNGILKFVSRTLFCMARGVILQTNQSVSYFPRYLRKKCIVLKNPLNPDFLESAGERKPEKTIVTVGRCDDNKNQKMLIDAFRLIANDFIDYKVIIYGNGPTYDKLLSYIEENNLSERIIMAGITDNTREAISNAGVFVLTSNTEGMPNALIEAMTLGIPCISTNCPCGGPAELIEDGTNGLLVPVNDAVVLSVALRKYLTNYDYAASVGRNAAKIKNILEPEHVCQEWETYILQ